MTDNSGNAFGSGTDVGLSKREYYAAIALQGILSYGEKPFGIEIDDMVDEICRAAFQYADSMLKHSKSG